MLDAFSLDGRRLAGQLADHRLVVVQAVEDDTTKHLPHMFEDGRRLIERFRIPMNDGTGLPQHAQHRSLELWTSGLLLRVDANAHMEIVLVHDLARPVMSNVLPPPCRRGQGSPDSPCGQPSV